MYLKIIFNLVIILLSIEYLSLFGFTSVFQLFILPLCVLGIFISKKEINFADYRFLFWIILIILFSFLSNFNDDLITSFFFGLGIFLFVYFFVLYLHNNSFSKYSVIIFSLYSLPHVVVFIYDFFSFGLLMSFTGSSFERFSGLHRDPNFMCVYINIAIVSKLSLIKYFVNSKFWKSFIWIFIIVDIFLILYSMSRSGILTCLFLFLSFFYLSRKRNFFLLILLLFPLFLILADIYTNLVYSNDMSLIESVLWRQKQTLVSANFEDTRIDSFFNIIELIKNEELGFVGYSYNDYLRRFDYFLHNTFLDILLFNGLYLGLIFLFSIVLNVFKFYSNVKNGFLYNWIFHICLVSLISFFFLSMYQQKLFWFVIVLLFYYSRKNIANFNYLQNG